MSVKEKLRALVEGTDTRSGKAFDWAIMGLIFYSIVTMTIETMPGLSDGSRRILRLSEIFVTLLFTAEYILRFYIEQRKRDYVFSFEGIIDLLAISPFYITLMLGLGGVDLRAVRAFPVAKNPETIENRALQQSNRKISSGVRHR